ncbi:MAG: tRNA dihydrouridine synthase DusB [Tissierellia bacterium]|nr:tRNA dihydrouridine synthase DusB [Tissierellia bacterium]
MKKDKINLILSPLAGVTDRAFRSICNKYSMDYAYTEMISAKGLFYSDKATEELLASFSGEENLGVQIFGSDPEIMGQMAKKISETRPYIKSIDLNMGCPAKKIIKNGEGSALMKDPELVKRIIFSIKENTDLPVSAKFRLGFDDQSKNYLEIGKICQDLACSHVTLHGRTTEQMYTGKADWDAIRRLNDKLDIEVVGNGDIFTPKDALDMMSYTGVSSVAIARGAMGNPFIFQQVKDLMKHGYYEQASLDLIIDTIFDHYKLLSEFKGPRIAVNEMRKHIAWYIKGLRGANKLKNEINMRKEIDQVFDLLENFRKEYKENAD